MPFITLDNNFSNLAQYYNRPFANKPEIPKDLNQFKSFDDGLIRGGVLNVGLASIKDTARIGKFYFSGKGVLFLIKQVGLQRSNPKLETPEKFITLSNNNTRLYNLGINTLAQVPLNALGGHIIRHGILPVGGVGFLEGDSLSNIKGYNYEKIVLENDKKDKNRNRLIGYLNKIKTITPGNTTPTLLQEYSGGAASVYGIGKTQIYTTSVKTDNPTESTLSYKDISSYIDGYRTITSSGFISSQQNEVIQLKSKALFNREMAKKLSGGAVGKISSTLTPISNQLNINADKLEAEAEAIQIPNFDFDIYNHPLYKTNNIQSRVGVSTSKFGPNNIKTTHKVDSINVIDIKDDGIFYQNYNDKKLSSEILTNYKNKVDGKFAKDIIKFRIEFLDNDSSTQKTDVLAFRAYINDFNDNMNAKWDAYRYMGRGEEFYVYNGFTRDITVDFTIFAHSPEEMKPIYQKLNYLLSAFAPDYNNFNKMRGNIGYLTVGDYLYRQPGIFTDIKLSGILDHHWEIALDTDQYEVPKHFKVNLSFKPIHDFLPRKVKSDKFNETPFITPNESKNKYLSA